MSAAAGNPIDPLRRSLYAKSSLGKKALGLDEDTVRLLLGTRYGKRSRTELGNGQLNTSAKPAQAWAGLARVPPFSLVAGAPPLNGRVQRGRTHGNGGKLARGAVLRPAHPANRAQQRSVGVEAFLDQVVAHVNVDHRADEQVAAAGLAWV